MSRSLARRLFKILTAAIFTVLTATGSAEELEADIIVYGDASGGVTAAVQATRMRKSAILVSQYGHLGGLSRVFYHQLYLHYQKPEAWTWEEQ
jgi:heterodisulfide reductase subunit A-like polyferredoxin